MRFPMDRKVVLLNEFYKYLTQSGWTFGECGTAHEKELLENFDKVIHVFSTLSKGYQAVIIDITKRMGEGMAEFIEKSVDSVEDWDKYCFYVAGLVGLGLSHLFAESRLENQWFANEAERSAVSMGLFLQKTNIIRDYREDIDETRIFWPTEIWSIYTDKLENFKEPQYAVPAVQCLNHLLTNALEHVPDVLEYMSHVQEPSVFSFCAIPQVMAVATMALCFNNHDVFVRVVKIRRGETAKIFTSLSDMDSLYTHFNFFARVIEAKIDPNDPNAQRTRAIVQRIQTLCGNRPVPSSLNVPLLAGGAVLTALVAYGTYAALSGRARS